MNVSCILSSWYYISPNLPFCFSFCCNVRRMMTPCLSMVQNFWHQYQTDDDRSQFFGRYIVQLIISIDLFQKREDKTSGFFILRLDNNNTFTYNPYFLVQEVLRKRSIIPVQRHTDLCISNIM